MRTEKFNAGGNPAMDWHPMQGGVDSPSCFMIQNPGQAPSGLMGHLTRMQTFSSTVISSYPRTVKCSAKSTRVLTSYPYQWHSPKFGKALIQWASSSFQLRSGSPKTFNHYWNCLIQLEIVSGLTENEITQRLHLSIEYGNKDTNGIFSEGVKKDKKIQTVHRYHGF